jgi:tRNA-5-methyluridine54 2-sulfurtransferase
MKCRKCSKRAVINMRQHKLALCKDHYLDWVPEQTERIIHKYQMFSHQERVLVAVSGGKDSLALWDILYRLGYQSDGLYIGLGIDGEIGYSDESLRCSRQFADERGLHLITVDVEQEHGETIPQIAGRTTRGKEKPCSVCGLTKRHIMNRVARQGEYQVLVTGHNLDDEAAVLFSNTMNWSASYLVRQGPVLEANGTGMVRKAKPLCRFYEREMAAYALLGGIVYIYDECPYAAGAKSIYYKEILNKMENDRPGAKLSFYLSYLQAKEAGLFAENADRGKVDLHPCPSCGQMTSTPGKCAFCRMVVRVNEI